MVAPYEKAFLAVAKGLTGKAEALLILACLLAMVALSFAGLPPRYAIGGPIGIYILYLLRAERSEYHELKLKRAEQRQLELQTQGSVQRVTRKQAAKPAPKSVPSSRSNEGKQP